ncbi:TPA_asm: RepB family plasmid replication initiator protein [Listeria monocytogenes]|nr:RepB family plasmid replication initiator protein [Listeria monocytogenes]
MSGETVVYRNEMNLVPLRNFTAAEIDLFFAMCNKLKEQNTQKIRISFGELKHLSNYYHRSLNRFTTDLSHIYDKMLNLTYTERGEKGFTRFVLFTSYTVNIEEQYLEIAINNDLEYVLNQITGDFTKFELQELSSLKSSYSKNMFRLLKQFKHTGYMYLTIEDFRERLDIPNSYRMTDINRNVFKPIINELSMIFKNLSINKIKAKKGRKITAIEFTFIPEQRINLKTLPSKHKKPKGSNVISKEKTPKWLQERKKTPKTTIKSQEEEKILEQKRQEFYKKLEENWSDC